MSSIDSLESLIHHNENDIKINAFTVSRNNDDRFSLEVINENFQNEFNLAFHDILKEQSSILK